MTRLPLKIALAAGLAAGGIGTLFWLLADVSLLYTALTAAAAALTVYAVVRQQVTDRLPRIEAVLNDLRAQGGRQDATPGDHGDEIDRITRRADQTHHAVTKRIEELSRADHHRRDYVGDVSHEIKTPIFAIQGFAETLLGGALDDPGVNRGFVERILQNANRLNALARDLAEISRLETGMIKLSRARFHVRRVYEEVRESLDLAARDKAIEIEIVIGAGSDVVDGDRDRIRQVITNLVDNAVKYGREGGRVELGAERAHDEVRLYVRDDGIGIAPGDLSRVTERFYRADKSRSRGQGGTGLGLAIVKHILVAHRTDLQIESTPGKGSAFSFKLPAVEERVDAVGQ